MRGGRYTRQHRDTAKRAAYDAAVAGNRSTVGQCPRAIGQQGDCSRCGAKGHLSGFGSMKERPAEPCKGAAP